MRFAFKTSPQNTTWAQMLAVWEQKTEVFDAWLVEHEPAAA